jgi:hypothetical protein
MKNLETIELGKNGIIENKLPRKENIKMKTQYEIHDVCKLFPNMKGKQFRDLKEDIELNGLVNPIIVYEGKLIDGKNRLKACQKLGIEPKIEEWKPNAGQSLVSFIVSLNLRRRHLTSSQRAVIAKDLLPFYEAEAKKRQGKRNDLINDFFGETSDKNLAQVDSDTSAKKLPEVSGRAKDLVAKDVGTNRTYLDDLEKIEKEKPDEIENIKLGNKSISKVKKEIQQEARRIKEQRGRERLQKMEDCVDQQYFYKAIEKSEALIYSFEKDIGIKNFFNVRKFTKIEDANTREIFVQCIIEQRKRFQKLSEAIFNLLNRAEKYAALLKTGRPIEWPIKYEEPNPEWEKFNKSYSWANWSNIKSKEDEELLKVLEEADKELEVAEA